MSQGGRKFYAGVALILMFFAGMLFAVGFEHKLLFDYSMQPTMLMAMIIFIWLGSVYFADAATRSTGVSPQELEEGAKRLDKEAEIWPMDSATRKFLDGEARGIRKVKERLQNPPK